MMLNICQSVIFQFLYKKTLNKVICVELHSVNPCLCNVNPKITSINSVTVTSIGTVADFLSELTDCMKCKLLFSTPLDLALVIQQQTVH